MATPYSKMTPEQKKRAHAANKAHKKKNPEMAAKWKHTHYMANRDKYLRIEKERSWMKLYGITPGQYEEMLAAQGGKCAICSSDKAGKKRQTFAVDHDHDTGLVRGLLCIRCNAHLGWFEPHGHKAIVYLAMHSGKKLRIAS
jgi:hypothetical protein